MVSHRNNYLPSPPASSHFIIVKHQRTHKHVTYAPTTATARSRSRARAAMAKEEELLSQLISIFESVQANVVETQSLLLSPIQLYQTGLLLYKYQHDNDSMILAYQEFLRCIPYSYLSVLFHEINQAYAVLVHSSTPNFATIATATRALSGLYCTSPLACQAGQSITLIHALSVAYDIVQHSTMDATTTNTEMLVLETLAAILMNGVLSDTNDNNENDNDGDDDDEQRISHIMEAIQAISVHDKSTTLADLYQMQSKCNPSLTLQSKLLLVLSPSPQRDYLLSMLTTTNMNPTTTYTTTSIRKDIPTNKKKLPPPLDPQTEILRRIQQVKTLLPQFGNGYIEVALSCFQGNVDQTVAALLDESRTLPPTLLALDPTLPGRFRETPNQYEPISDEAKEIAKERIRHMQQQEEEEAYLLSVMGNITTTTSSNNEYDDDYDDQYDDFDGGAGIGDNGGLDVDWETIKKYNKVARENERDESFWSESRNTNREKVLPGKKDTNDSDDNYDDGEEKTYRGFDKIKGGRPIGPDGKVLPRQKGGKQGPTMDNGVATDLKKPSQVANKDGAKQVGPKDSAANKKASTNSNGGNKPTDGPTELTKLQKRRKMLNKAKTGNHHRKDAAQRKTGGMG